MEGGLSSEYLQYFINPSYYGEIIIWDEQNMN
jgi:hypothetical protein